MSTIHHCSYLKTNEISWARFADEIPPFLARKKRLRGRRRQGIIYEQRAHEHFEDLYGFAYVKSPWLVYSVNGSRPLYAQPDGLLIQIDKGLIIVCEMKYQHCVDAYWQLVGKYVPLVQKIFPSGLWKVATVEVVRWYDCATKYPAAVTLKSTISKAKPGEFGVHIWKP